MTKGVIVKEVNKIVKKIIYLSLINYIKSVYLTIHKFYVRIQDQSRNHCGWLNTQILCNYSCTYKIWMKEYLYVKNCV